MYIRQRLTEVEINWVPMGRCKAIDKSENSDVDLKLDIVIDKLKMIEKLIQTKERNAK